MSETKPALVRASLNGYRWEEVPNLPYKDNASAPFKAVSRQVLFADPQLGCELRYFEVEPGGYSSLERHEHVHAVMILRGRGLCLVGEQVSEVQPHDLVNVPGWTWHQFRATGDEPLGFLCLVNQVRDKPQLPTEEELSELKSNPVVAAFLSS
ncbi:MAG: cupin domain-containing protein [Acetobacteraceae bacterium]|nr:cupin domain-containing protein [Acetobacteraceae bacterium]MBV8525725.1 cupin domain-containing protein [Acetobacteraceae bacterium]MBV8588959.1 cupin domain-containing protein [Acetobacteraceae bacterium]